MKSHFFDRKMVSTAEQALDLIENMLQFSTEFSIIGNDLEGNILLWNEGARRLYGYEPDEVIGKVNSAVLHTPEDVAAGVPRQASGRRGRRLWADPRLSAASRAAAIQPSRR